MKISCPFDYSLEPSPAIAQASWDGDPDVLERGSAVDILAVDPAGRLSRALGASGLPCRTACWIRYWPEDCDHAQFRSCDLADLEVSGEDFDRLMRSRSDAP